MKTWKSLSESIWFCLFWYKLYLEGSRPADLIIAGQYEAPQVMAALLTMRRGKVSGEKIHFGKKKKRYRAPIPRCDKTPANAAAKRTQ